MQALRLGVVETYCLLQMTPVFTQQGAASLRSRSRLRLTGAGQDGCAARKPELEPLYSEADG